MEEVHYVRDRIFQSDVWYGSEALPKIEAGIYLIRLYDYLSNRFETVVGYVENQDCIKLAFESRFLNDNELDRIIAFKPINIEDLTGRKSISQMDGYAVDKTTGMVIVIDDFKKRCEG